MGSESFSISNRASKLSRIDRGMLVRLQVIENARQRLRIEKIREEYYNQPAANLQRCSVMSYQDQAHQIITARLSIEEAEPNRD